MPPLFCEDFMNIIDFEFGGKEFKIPLWDMRKQLQNENIIMPLIKEPLMTAAAMATSSEMGEELFMAGLVEGLLEALSGIDMLKLVELLLEGINVRSTKGGLINATIENLQEEGCDLATVHVLCVKVIQENYKPLLKKDLMGSLTNLLDQSLIENPSSTSE